MKTGTAVAVLACFLWMACGGHAWAEARTARNDPAHFLLRMAEDPRLALSTEERGYLRQAAKRLETEGRPQPVRRPAAAPAGPDPAAEMHDIARQLGALSAPAASPAGIERAVAVADLKVRLQGVHRRTLAEFKETGERLRAARLAQVILDRHDATRAEYSKNIEMVFRDLDAAAGAGDPEKGRAAIEAAAELLGRSNTERPHQVLDPSRLPFRAAEPVARKPALPQDGGPIKLLHDAAAAPPTPADLAESPDVQITPEIRALAASLGNQPLKIYEWVRNNIEFVPTYGSVQGSRLTLIAKRGNAFDTASLLLALLRAANVPARYVTGTVEVPVGLMTNWLGGVATPRVAQQLLGQGGVPNVGLLSGGTLTHIRMDHVWVEALVDYIPSRGAAVQREGDTWVPLDASFKLHSLRPVPDLIADPSLGTVLQPGDHLFDVDESLGKITNVSDDILDERLESWLVQTREDLRTQGIELSVQGLVGGATIITEPSRAFAGSLPYDVVARQSAVSALPASLRHSVQLKGFASEFDRAFGSPAFAVELGLPTLNSRRLGIRFEPATQADADTLEAARNGGASSLPVYLVNVVPVIRLDETEVGRGAPVRMGSFYSIDVVFRGPDGPTTIPYRVVAGDEIVAGITGNGVTREVVAERFAGHAVDNPAEYLHQVGLHYWAECDYVSNITARPLGVHMLRLPSVGFFSSPLTVSYLFGSPRSAVYESRIMDVKQSLMGAAGADPLKVVSFMKQSGLAGSYLEGAVFDQLEDRELPASQGISAVHLISDATDLAIPIYRITQANSAAVLPLLQLSSAVESDIRTAVGQGKTVLVPESEILDGPWRGVGYIIQDEATGAGAYMISGGANGGGLLDCIRELVPRWVVVLVIALAIIIAIILLALLLAKFAPVLVPVLVAAAVTPEATTTTQGPAARGFTGFLLLLRGLGLLSLA